MNVYYRMITLLLILDSRSYADRKGMRAINFLTQEI